MIIVAGSSNRLLSESLSAVTGFRIVPSEQRRFPDGECYVRVNGGLENHDVLIVSATFPDGNIVETLLLYDAVRRLRPSTIRLLIPYFGYQRQDKLFREGEAVSAEVMAGLLDSKFDEIITIDIHAEGVLSYFRHTGTLNFVASPEIARHFRARNIDVVISPDGGMRAVEYAKEAARALNCSYDYFLKERINANTVKLFPKNMDVSGKNVLVLDDIIATGGSMIAVLRRLQDLGAASIFAGCTHGLFIGDALQKIKALCSEVVSTDTIESSVSLVSVAPLVAHHLMETAR